jgi:hypothetical protein
MGDSEEPAFDCNQTGQRAPGAGSATRGAMLPTMLALPGELEALYWSSNDTIDRIIRIDVIGALLGFVIHVMIVLFKVKWGAVARAVAAVNAVTQLMQVRAGESLRRTPAPRCRPGFSPAPAAPAPDTRHPAPHPPQAYWAWRHRGSYLPRRVRTAVAQRIRWVLYNIIVPVTCGSTQNLLPLHWQGSATGQELLSARAVGFFFGPAIFVALIHPAPFSVHVPLVALTLLQHMLFQLPHVVRAVELMGMRPLVDKACRVLYVMLDPSLLSQGPTSTPAFCTAAYPSFLPMYIYIMLGGVLTSHLVFWNEYFHKMAFLRKRQAEGLNDLALTDPSARRFWDVHGRARMSPMQALVCCWASCAITWSLLAFAFTLGPQLVPWDGELVRRMAGVR